MRTELQDKIYNRGALERWLRNPPKNIRNYLKKEIDYLIKNIPFNSVLLDVGCGFGRHLKVLAPKVKKAVGIDYNDYMIRMAEKELKNFKNVKLYVENAKKMHFKDNIFDVVICMLNTFGDFGKNKIPILKEMKRVCKKNGKIIITVWSENSLSDRLEAYKGAGWKIKKVEGNNITIKGSHTSETLTKGRLFEIFSKVDLQPKIIRLTKVSYLIESIK